MARLVIVENLPVLNRALYWRGRRDALREALEQLRGLV